MLADVLPTPPDGGRGTLPANSRYLAVRGHANYHPAPPLLRSNQTPVTVLPRLRAFLVGARDGNKAIEGHAVGSYRIAAMIVTRNTTRKMKNRMRATPAAVDATPPN